MRIIYNPDEKIVKAIREGILKKGGHCPCRREMTEDTMCMCKEFREQIADEQFEGFCHCMLYYKEKQREFRIGFHIFIGQYHKIEAKLS